MAGFSGTYAGGWLDPRAPSQNWWNPPHLVNPYLISPGTPVVGYNDQRYPHQAPWNNDLSQASCCADVQHGPQSDQTAGQSKPEFCSVCGKRYQQPAKRNGSHSLRSSPTPKECNSCDQQHSSSQSSPKTRQTISSPRERSLSSFLSFSDPIQEDSKRNHQPAVDKCREDKAQEKFAVSLCKYINDNLIGKDTIVHTPYGHFKVIYLDYTASGRNVKFIEAYIRQHVLPIYANTHSESSCCSEQTENYREEARDIIRRCVNATEKDVVLFVGSGTTAAINKLVEALNLKTGCTNKVTLIMSALEHHSNILPWKESGVEVIRIPLSKEGLMCINTLTKTLKKLTSENRIILCSFTAASNVTGILLDVDMISSVVHSYGGFVFWDYAAAAPYVKINMNTSDTCYKDAVFVSGHKFIGGPGSPGVLVAKYYLFKNPVPTSPGGGTVLMVTKSTHLYLTDIEKREEGGTPDIIGSIRAGLVFQLKRAVTDTYIEMRDQVLCEKFFSRLAGNRRIIILGNAKVKRLPIFSFLIIHQATGLLLHHNFVARLLNDLFGIQSRPGCVCAGPYTQDLLDVDEEFALKLIALQASAACKEACFPSSGNVKHDAESPLGIMKAGFTRISLPFFFSDHMINEIIDTIQFIADHGWNFLPQYTYEISHGIWTHRTFDKKYNSLEKITYENGRMYFEALINNGTPVSALLPHALSKLKETKDFASTIDFSKDPVIELGGDEERMRWFLLPNEAARMILRGKFEKHGLPFVPIDGKDKVKAQSGALRLTEEKDKIYISKKKKDRRISPDKKPKI